MFNRIGIVTLTALAGGLLGLGQVNAATIYVDDDAPPGGNGSTWATAYNDLQDALDDAASGDEIRVGAGTYKPIRRCVPQDATIMVFVYTDSSPEETTWELVDQDGALVASGGPYANPMAYYEHEIPVDTCGCYDFTVYDSGCNGLEGSCHVYYEDLPMGYISGAFGCSETIPDIGDCGAPVTATFVLINGVAIYGGYAGYGAPNPNERDVQLHETILSGDLFGDDDSGGDCALQWSDCCSPHEGPGCDSPACEFHICYEESGHEECMEWDEWGNCIWWEWFTDPPPGWWCCEEGYEWDQECADLAFDLCVGCFGSSTGSDCENSIHVVTASGTDQSTLLDGVLITGGKANWSSEALGGGMFIMNGSPSLNDCVFEGNRADSGGGGLYLKGGSPSLTNCVFRENRFEGSSSVSGGGGLHLEGGSPSLTNCVFLDNRSPLGGVEFGGGVYARDSTLTFSACTFQGNFVGDGGGGLYVSGASTATLLGCVFADNIMYAGWGAAIGVEGEDASLSAQSCVFTGNDGGGRKLLHHLLRELCECQSGRLSRLCERG